MKKINMIGAGGHARSVIGLLERLSFKINALYDDGFKTEEIILGYPLKGICTEIKEELEIVLAIGDCFARRKYYETYLPIILKDNLIHPSAIIENHTQFGLANNIFARTFINNGVIVGDNNLINTGAILEHEVVVGSHNHISVGATMLGKSSLGDNCFLAAGAIVKEKVKIGNNIIIGANSFVADNLIEPGVYVGSPARRVK